MKLTKSLFLLVLTTLSVIAFGDKVQAQVLDGVYEEVTRPDRQIIPYEHVREADVFNSKRIWRTVDVREKINLPFKFPKEPLIQIIHEAAKNGELTVYDNAVDYSDEFVKELPVEEVEAIGYSKDTQFTVDPITFQEVETVVENQLTWDKIVKFKIKEDWYFDENLSTFKVRIIGIAPVMEDYDDNGNYRGDLTMYWVYFPDLRPILVNHDVFNADNDAISMNWDQLFHQRLFASYIYKESNVHDRNIQEYATGLDALLEAERIKKEMRTFEHDLWTY